MNAKSLKTLAVVLGGAACLSTAAFAAPGQYNTDDASVPASRDTSGQTVIPGSPSTMPGSGSGTGGSGSPGSTPGATSTPGAATAPGAASTPGMDATQSSTAMTDGDILGVLTAIDDNEIAAANAAQKEKLGAKAKKYGKMIKKEHSANSVQVKKLAKKLGISPTENQRAAELRTKGAQDLAAIVPLQGKEFERAYIDAMVAGHTDVLQVIETELLPAATNEEVRTQVSAMRDHVSAHLEAGKRLQESQASLAE